MGGAHSEHEDFAKSARRDVIYPFHLKEKNYSTKSSFFFGGGGGGGGSWNVWGGGGGKLPPPPPPPPPPLDRTLTSLFTV